jgi:hypothetical protein
MLGLNYMAWLGLLVWVGVPLLAILATVLLWQHSRSALTKGAALVAGFSILSVPALISNGVKAHYDRQVREMCAKDGGVRVYEMVRLAPEKFNEWGQVRIPYKLRAKPDDQYFYESLTNQLRNGNPEIWQSQHKVYRRADDKLLGESLGYARRGGDLPGPWHESSFGCPGNADITDLNKQIFAKN